MAKYYEKSITIFTILFFTKIIFAQSIINRDLAIEGMVKEILLDSLRSYIQTKVNFGTRNTLSIQTNSKRGIGAARLYVLAKFNEFSKAN